MTGLDKIIPGATQTKALTLGGKVIIHQIIDQYEGKVNILNNPLTILTTFGNATTGWTDLNVGGMVSNARACLLECGLATVSGGGQAFLEIRPYGETGIHGRVYSNIQIPVFFIYPRMRFSDTTDYRMQWRITVVGICNWQLEIRNMGAIYEKEDHKHNVSPDPHDHPI